MFTFLFLYMKYNFSIIFFLKSYKNHEFMNASAIFLFIYVESMVFHQIQRNGIIKFKETVSYLDIYDRMQ